MNNDPMVAARSPLVAATALAEELEDVPPVLLDVRWTPAGPSLDAHLAGHLPGAVFVDLDRELSGPPLQPPSAGRHPLPEPGALQEVWRSAGISGTTPVVVHDERDSSIAARAWWLLRWSGHRDVRVLDGGLAAWRRVGLPLLTGPTEPPEPGWMSVTPGSMPAVETSVVAGASSGSVLLLDARAAARYRGDHEPLDPVAGHIPGAVNLPLTDLVTADGTFRDPQQIADRFAAAGLSAADSSQRPVVASCGSGVTACHLVLAGEIAGLRLALYPGSFSGWIGAGLPVATGDSASPSDDDAVPAAR